MQGQKGKFKDPCIQSFADVIYGWSPTETTEGKIPGKLWEPSAVERK